MIQKGSRVFLFTMAIAFVSISQLFFFGGGALKFDRQSLPTFLYYSETEKPTLIFTVIVFTVSCRTHNHRWKRKQMHRNYFRITTALCQYNGRIVAHCWHAGSSPCQCTSSVALPGQANDWILKNDNLLMIQLANKQQRLQYLLTQLIINTLNVTQHYVHKTSTTNNTSSSMQTKNVTRKL